MWIQIFLVISIILIGVTLTTSVASDSHLALRRLFIFGVILVAVVLIFVPEWLTAIANLLGIGRGTDLLLYALVIAFGGYVASDYRRNVKVKQDMTNLARELALAEARVEDAWGREHR